MPNPRSRLAEIYNEHDYPLTAPDDKPFTKNFCAAVANSSGGSTERQTAAEISPQRTPYEVTKLAAPTVTGVASLEVRTTANK
jgi:hypothetical protein